MRIKKTVINSFTSLLYQFILIISGLIVPRLILAKYGSGCNGVVSSVTQFMSFISLLTIGLTAATRVELYKSLAIDDYYRTGQIVFTIKKYMHKVAYVLATYVIILAIVFPCFVNISLPSRRISLLIIVIGLGSFFEYFIGIPYRILLQADQKNYIENILSSFSCIVYTFFSVMLIINDASLITVKMTSVLTSLSVMIVISLYARKKYKLNEYIENKEILLPLQKDAAIHSIANIVHQNSDIVILTLFTNTKIVSVYTVYYFVAGQIKKLMVSFNESLESAFGNIWAKKETQLLRDRFKQYEFIIYFIVVIVFSCTVSLLLPFVALYTKGVNDINYIRPCFALLMVLTEMIYCLRQPYVTIVQAAGKYKETRNIAVIEAVVNLSISIILVRKLGIDGVIIGTLFANLIRTVYYIRFSYVNILNSDIKFLVLRILWFLLTFIAIINFSGILLKGIIFGTWLQWIKWGFILAMLSLSITVLSSLLLQRNDFIGVIKTLGSGLVNR